MRFSRLLLLLFFLSAVVLLGGMFWQVGMAGLVATLHTLGPWIGPFMLLEIGPILLHTAGLAACLPPGRLPLRLWQLALVQQAGDAFNYITPTAEIGGDVLKVFLLEPLLSREQATAVVVIDKATMTLAKMLYLATGLLYITQQLTLPRELHLSLSLSIGLVTLGLLGFVALQRYSVLSRFLTWLEYLRVGQETLRRLRQPVLSMEAHLVTYYTHYPWRFCYSLFLHAMAMVLRIFKTYLLLRLMLPDSALSQAIVVTVAVAALDQLFFFVPGRLGTLEGARFMVLSTLGIAQIYGLAFGLIARVEQLLWGGIGLGAYVLFTRLFPPLAKRLDPQAPTSG